MVSVPWGKSTVCLFVYLATLNNLVLLVYINQRKKVQGMIFLTEFSTIFQFPSERQLTGIFLPPSSTMKNFHHEKLISKIRGVQGVRGGDKTAKSISHVQLEFESVRSISSLHVKLLQHTKISLNTEQYSYYFRQNKQLKITKIATKDCKKK